VRRLLGFLIVIVLLVAVFRGCDQETGGVEEKEEQAGVEEVAEEEAYSRLEGPFVMPPCPLLLRQWSVTVEC
jgi:hypothetical protein